MVGYAYKKEKLQNWKKYILLEQEKEQENRKEEKRIDEKWNKQGKWQLKQQKV